MSTICYVRVDFESPTDFNKTHSPDPLIFKHNKTYYQHYFFTRLNKWPLNGYVCGIDASPPEYTINKRCVDDSFLIFVVKGKGTLNSVPFYAGQFFFLPPKFETTMGSDKKSPWTLCWIAWKGYVSESFAHISELFEPCRPYFNPNSAMTLKLFSSFIYSDLSHSDVDTTIISFSNLILSMYAKDISLSDTQRRGDFGKLDIKYVETAKKIMAEEFSTITIAKLSEQLFLNRKYFCEVFKRVTDISPHDYLINLRLNNSLLFLENTGMTLKQVSVACGYSTYNGYVEAFRKKFGITPREYRKNI